MKNMILIFVTFYQRNTVQTVECLQGTNLVASDMMFFGVECCHGCVQSLLPDVHSA